MSSYGQFCSVARALDLLGGRWTLLVVREVLCGSTRFTEIRRGIPRVSRTILSERLQALVAAGVLDRTEGSHGPEYALTDAGRELAGVVGALGTWGQRRLPRDPIPDDLDLEPLLLDMRRRVRFAALPPEPVVVRFDLDSRKPRYLLLRPTEASLCDHNPGYPERVRIGGPIAALVAWWRGDATFPAARRRGLVIDGDAASVRSFPDFFDRYLFADVAPAQEHAS
jgi:DNA-binding HxlR family transcriptional regulator